MACKSFACQKVWPQFEKQNERQSWLFDALNLEILQLSSSTKHKRYMARKASMLLI